MNLEGKIIGNRYEIIEKIGNGGMATVYKARCTILNRYVAVKVLREEFTTDEEFIKRFNSEAQAAASLTHPNIVSVYDVGQEYNIYYIVMELIQGKTLKQIIEEEGALPWKWTVNIAIQICSALEVAHKNGIIHRDIKPHNIIITEDGMAKVTDFGIAKAVSNSTITAFGTTIGSVHYFSPEHARGGYTDAKSDLYSLGVVMYEMVTGKVPFDADTPVSVALKHMQEEPIEPINLNSRLPVAVNQIIMKAMKKDTSFRYASATEMIKDLSLALKEPNGGFVKQRTTNDFTRVIPTISDEMLEENKKNIRTSKENEKRNSSSEPKTGIAKFMDEHPTASRAIIVAIVIALFAIVFFGSWKVTTKLLGIGENSSTSSIQIPNVEGKSLEEAKKILDSAGIKYDNIEEVYNDTVQTGYVISQSQKAGNNYVAGKNAPIKLTVSKGIKVVKMPNVKGMKLEEAKESITKAELVLNENTGIIQEESQTVEAGVVIRQEISPDTEINAGTEVKIYVSKGMKQVEVPYVIDKDVEEAKKTLTALPLEVNVIYDEDTSKSNGIVLKQSIDFGKKVDEGSAITLTVNKIQEIKQGVVNINVKSLTGYKEPEKTSGNEAKDSEKQEPKKVSVRVKVNDESVYNQSVAENTENVSVTVKGKGNIEIKVYIDELLKETKQMDLNSSNTTLDIN